MVSWNDGEMSDESLSLFSSAYDSEPYIPETIVDPEWCGIVSRGPLCNHKAPVERGVVFQSIHTGRRFFGCAEEEGYNYGLVELVDPEWPEPLKNALRKLWDMYKQSTKEIKAKEELIAQLAQEELIQEKYQNNIKETNALFSSIHKKVMIENYQQINQDSDAKKVAPHGSEERANIEKENIELKREIELLKQIHATQAELISNWRKDAAVDEVKQEKKRLEYALSEFSRLERSTSLRSRESRLFVMSDCNN